MRFVAAELTNSMKWAQYLGTFPYRLQNGKLVLAKRRLILFFVNLLNANCTVPFFLNFAIHRISETQVTARLTSYAQVTIVTALLNTTLCLSIVYRKNIQSIVDDFFRIERSLMKIDLIARPHKRSKCLDWSVTLIVIVGAFHLGLPDSSVTEVVFAYSQLLMVHSIGSLVAGLMSISDHIFTLLNATAHVNSTFSRIETLSALHSQTVAVSRKINVAFSYYLSLLLVAAFFFVTSNLYNVVDMNANSTSYPVMFIKIVWIIVYTVLPGHVINTFQSTTDEAARFRRTLCHHFSTGPQTMSLTDMAYKLQIDKLHFTLHGFVDIHPSLLLKILSSTVTLLILIVD